MSDVNTETVAEVNASVVAATAEPSSVISVPCVKGGAPIDINIDELPNEVFREMCFQGLKQILNRNMSKTVKAAYNDADAKKAGHADSAAHLKADAMKIAAKNVEDMKAGKIRLTSAGKAAKTSGEVNTEAMRLARVIAKQTIKEAKLRISDYDASEITKFAKMILAKDPSIVKMAEKNVAERHEKKVAGMDLSKIISVNAEKVKKNDAKKAAKKDKAPLSATQAGQTAARAKPGSQPSTRH